MISPHVNKFGRYVICNCVLESKISEVSNQNPSLTLVAEALHHLLLCVILSDRKLPFLGTQHNSSSYLNTET